MKALVPDRLGVRLRALLEERTLARWRPEPRVTRARIQWSPNLPGMLRAQGWRDDLTDVPPTLQTDGARHVLVVPTAREAVWSA